MQDPSVFPYSRLRFTMRATIKHRRFSSEKKAGSSTTARTSTATRRTGSVIGGKSISEVLQTYFGRLFVTVQRRVEGYLQVGHGAHIDQVFGTPREAL